MAEKKDSNRRHNPAEEASHPEVQPSTIGKAGTIRQRHEQFQSEAERGTHLNPAWSGQGTTQDVSKHQGEILGGTNPGTARPKPATTTHRSRSQDFIENESFLDGKNWEDLDEDSYQDGMDEGLDDDEDGGMRRDENRGFGVEI